MLGFWAVAILRGSVPGITSGGTEIWFHISAEVLTELVLIAGGVGVFVDVAASRSIVLSALGLGMLVYTLIASPGYCEDQRIGDHGETPTSCPTAARRGTRRPSAAGGAFAAGGVPSRRGPPPCLVAGAPPRPPVLRPRGQDRNSTREVCPPIRWSAPSNDGTSPLLSCSEGSGFLRCWRSSCVSWSFDCPSPSLR